MPSSTSNSELDFEVNRREVRNGLKSWLTAMIGVALMLAVGEVVVRRVILPRAEDLGRYRGFAKQIDELLARPGSHVVFLGNSVTGQCIDPQQFQELCATDLKQPVSAVSIAADGSGIATWYYMIKHYLAKGHSLPDLLVFNHFQNGMLLHEEKVEIGRLAREFTDLGDWMEVFSHETPSLGAKLDFALCYASTLYAYRSRIGLNVLGSLSQNVPLVTANVRENALRHNELMQERHSKKNVAAATETAEEADVKEVTRLAKLCQQLQCKTVFIAYPQDKAHPNGHYTPHPTALQVLQSCGMVTLDLRDSPELSTEHYKHEPFHDWTHMNAEGRKVYSRLLAKTLTPFIAEKQQQQ